MKIKTMAALLAALTTLCQVAAAQESGFLKIIALEGEGAFNDIRRKIARDPVVEVRDEANRVVAGAPVVFSLPDSGPSGTFAGASRIFTATTDAQGRARAEGLKPNSIEGRFNIKVTASAGGRSGTAVISQSNTRAGGVLTMAEQGKSRKKLYVLLGLVAGGAAGGAIAATRGGGGSAINTGPVPTVLSGGIVSVGGPR